MARRRARLRHFETNALTCRICKGTLDCATDPRGNKERPSTGSFSICMYCGEVSIYIEHEDGSYSLREPNFIELAIFNREASDVARAAAAARLSMPVEPFLR